MLLLYPTALFIAYYIHKDSPQPFLTAPTVEQASYDTVVLSWSSPGGSIDAYVVQYKQQSDDWSSEVTSEIVLSGQTLAVMLKGLNPGTYNLRIKTRNGNGDSEFGPEALFSAGRYICN